MWKGHMYLKINQIHIEIAWKKSFGHSRTRTMEKPQQKPSFLSSPLLAPTQKEKGQGKRIKKNQTH